MLEVPWDKIATHGLWLLGLGMVLAAISFWDYNRRDAWVTVTETWRSLTDRPWLHLGGLLFCAGMAITANYWFEVGGWGLLGLYMAYDWWVKNHGKSKNASPVELPTGTYSTELPVASASLPRRSRVQRLAAWIMSMELLWLGLLSPFFLFPAPSRLLPLLGLPLLWVIRRIAHGRFLPRTPLDWPIVLLAVMVLVSLFATFDVTISLERISYLLFGVGLYYAVVEWATPHRTADRVKWVVATFIFMGLGLGIIGLLGSNWAEKLPIVGQLATRLPSVLRGVPGEEGGFNPTIIGGSLLWVLPLQMAVLGWSSSRGQRKSWVTWVLRVGLLLTVTLLVGVLVLAQSRSALFGLLLGILLLLWLARSRIVPLLVIALVAGVAATVYIGPEKVADSLFVLRDNTEGGLYSVVIRAEVWSHALYGIEDFSFTGMGMGTFKAMLPLLYPTSYPENNITHAHNMFLQAALDLGLPGLIGYLALWMGAAAMAVQTWRRSHDSLSRAVGAGIAACLLSSFVLGMTDVGMMVPKTGFLFWALLGLLAALWKHSRYAAPAEYADEINEETSTEAGTTHLERTPAEAEERQPVPA